MPPEQVMPDLRVPKRPEHGISRAKAHLLAEGSHWLATGEVFHVETEPMGRFLARMDRVIPSGEHFEWLITPHEGLDGRPMDYIDGDLLEPLEALLDRLEEESDGACGSGAAAARPVS